MSNGIGEARLAQLPDDLWIEAENPEGLRFGMKVSTFKEVYKDKDYKIVARGDGKPLLEGNQVNTDPTIPSVQTQEANLPEQTQETGENQEG